MTIPQTWFCRIDLRRLTPTLQNTDVSFYYLCSCLSTQFLKRTVAKTTFNVKDIKSDIIKNSITLTINITAFPTKNRKNGGKTTSAFYHFLCSIIYNNFYSISNCIYNLFFYILN